MYFSSGNESRGRIEINCFTREVPNKNNTVSTEKVPNRYYSKSVLMKKLELLKVHKEVGLRLLGVDNSLLDVYTLRLCTGFHAPDFMRLDFWTPKLLCSRGINKSSNIFFNCLSKNSFFQ